jgi:hypothetical protein
MDPLSPRIRPAPASVLPALLLALAACSGEAPGPGEEEGPDAGADTAVPERHFERSLAFLTPTDSLIVVPWVLEAQAGGDGVDRSARAWLYRSGAWELFLDERWETRATRFPWRPLPTGPMRLLVGAEDALERLVFHEPPRSLEIEMGAPLADWTGSRGGVFRLLEGALHLAERRVPGLVLDVNLVRDGEVPAGDWMVLTSGDSLQVVAHQPVPGGDADAPFRVWARLEFRTLQWAEVRVEWTRTRAYAPARRDVPTGWRLEAPEAELQGTLTSLEAELEPRESEAAQPPLDAVYAVEGTLEIEGGEYPVRGLIRHVQG